MSGKRYRIVVLGEVDAATLERLGEPEAHVSANRTELVCDVIDQSQLIGMLSALSGVRIEVISAIPWIPRGSSLYDRCAGTEASVPAQ